MSSKSLRRYVDLPALIYMLANKNLSLLSPDSWDDSNDSHYLSLYRSKKKLETVLAACFSQTRETYHHWRVFASGPSGVCVRFDRTRFLQNAKNNPGVHGGKVKYMRLGDMGQNQLSIEDLPFSKRTAYEDEEEYRLIFESADKRISKIDVDFPLDCIKSITLSPWMHPDLADDVKEVLRGIKGCRNLKLQRSTLIGNEEWKEYGEAAV